jgi:hypothetical protein
MARPRNKSKVYGRYGGVTDSNYYNASSHSQSNQSLNLDDRNENITFTSADKRRLEELLAAAQFVENNADNIMLRVNTNSQPGNIDTFVITTSGKPEDTIEYTSIKDRVVLDKLAGGGVVSDSGDNDGIDGGFF